MKEIRTMKTTLWPLFLAAVLLIALAGACAPAGDESFDAEADVEGAAAVKDTLDDDDDATAVPPVPTDDAYEQAGPQGDGTFILPNGRLISPVGERVTLNRFPISIAAHPTADRLYVATARTPTVYVINALTMEVITETPISHHFGGMAINQAGDTLWVANGRSEIVHEFAIAGDTLTETRQIPAFGYPTDIVLSADEETMFVSLAFGKRVAAIDVDTGLEIGTMNAGYYTFSVTLAESVNRVVAANWGTSAVSVFNLETGALLADVEVGKNPEGTLLAADGRSVYVACADSDEVHKVDTVDLTVTQVISLDPDGDLGYGAMPTQLAFSPDGEDLYVVCTGFNAVAVIDPDTGAIRGRIPTEWYPTIMQPKDDMLFVVTGKGTGSSPGAVPKDDPDDLPIIGGQLLGSVEAIVTPGQATLDDYNDMVLANNARTADFYDLEQNYASPIPTQRGVPSEQIKHVVFILKENKTFDQVLSDLPNVDGDDSLLMWGDFFTPNLHALAQEFTVLDNYYSESHESDMGHSWATQVVANDYVEKTWVAASWQTLSGVEPAAVPESGTVFHHLVENDIDFRVYGEIVGTMTDIELFAPYVDFNFGFYSMKVSDRIKAREAIREWEAGVFPPFIYIALPNDHTEGTSSGKPTMEYLVADNDAALGEIVDWIKNSEYWDETAIFITEDDPQSGVDHIDAHRTPCVVVSPYAKHGHVSSVHHSMASLWTTIELILGLPTLTNYDRYTAPLFDSFQTEPVLATNFTAIPSNVPYAENPSGLVFADYCAKQIWDSPDQVERISEVVWAYLKPGVPYPTHLGVAPSEREAEEEDEGENAIEYAQMMRAYIDYAKRNNLLDPEFSLVDRQLHVR
jgi:DNA-binding beta-propeller fold protein YncE